MGGDGGVEGCQHDGPGDPGVRGDPQRVAGVVIEPGQDLGAGAVGEGVVGEVGLSAFVGQFGGEPQVGRARAFARLGDHEPGPGQVPADRRR